MFISSNDRKQKSAVDKDKTEKPKKPSFSTNFGYFFGTQNEDPSKDPRVYVLGKVSAGKEEMEKETEKER